MSIAVSFMTKTEARECVDAIHRGMEGIRVHVLDLYDREGWRALGYHSWRECVVAEFDQSKSQLYRQLQAAIIEREISPIGEIGIIPEGQLRPLSKLESADRKPAWDLAVESAPDGKPTAKHVEAVVAEIAGKHKAVPAPAIDAEDDEQDAYERAEVEAAQPDEEFTEEQDEPVPVPTGNNRVPLPGQAELFGPGEDGPTPPEARVEFQKWNARLGKLIVDINAVTCGIGDNVWIIPATLTKQDRNNIKAAEAQMQELREAASEFIRKMRAVRCEK